MSQPALAAWHGTERGIALSKPECCERTWYFRIFWGNGICIQVWARSERSVMYSNRGYNFSVNELPLQLTQEVITPSSLYPRFTRGLWDPISNV